MPSDRRTVRCCWTTGIARPAARRVAHSPRDSRPCHRPPRRGQLRAVAVLLLSSSVGRPPRSAKVSRGLQTRGIPPSCGPACSAPPLRRTPASAPRRPTRRPRQQPSARRDPTALHAQTSPRDPGGARSPGPNRAVGRKGAWVVEGNGPDRDPSTNTLGTSAAAAPHDEVTRREDARSIGRTTRKKEADYITVRVHKGFYVTRISYSIRVPERYEQWLRVMS